MENIHDYSYEYDYLFREILMNMVNKSTKKHVLRKINPNMYQKALNDFMKFGRITNYPTKYIEQWKYIIIENFTYLDVITMFFGHTSYFDVDTFNDMVLNAEETGKSVSDWSEAMEYMEEMGYYETLDNILPRFSNGSDLVSDYGLEPLREIIHELINSTDPNEILILINKALDVSHQTSDLSEIFIEGGEKSLNMISGVNEDIMRVVREEVNNFMNENDYAGQHSAPHANSNDAPMHDLTDIYGDDIYTNNAASYFKHYGDNRDYGAINIIQSARNKPNQSIKIYRAVPNVNYDNDLKLKELGNIISYYRKYKFFPMKNEIIGSLDKKYKNFNYDDKMKHIFDDINAQFNEIYSNKNKPLPINNSDWVTIDRNYAKEHGISNLNNKFKIVSKTVSAKHLFTDGNDIFEWGYDSN
ncbi:MAG: hypothetical protein PF487_15055 [Bacteroidales bacterium]|jgi:hypothetical protein|nr:hypothetical protein [Bacteroidales bacterium]